MTDSSALDIKERVDFLFKNYLGFPNTDETKPYFNETNVKANNYVLGEDVFISNIPIDPSFNTAKTSAQVQLTNSAFDSYSATDSITEDTTATIRKYVKLKLEPVPGSNEKSYYKLDASGNNVLSDSIQFNKNQEGSNTPYLYKLFSSAGVGENEQIPSTSTGGNWIFDIKNGIINFPDTPSETVNTSNPPYLTFYKYIGRKGISNITNDLSQLNTDNTSVINDLSSAIYEKLSIEIRDLSSESVRDISDLSSIAFHIFSTEIADLSSETVRDISFAKSQLSHELSTEISDLSSSTSTEISELSSITFSTLSTEISDLSSETSRDISAAKSLTSYEISDLSSYTSSELSREINELSTTTSEEIWTFLVTHQVNYHVK